MGSYIGGQRVLPDGTVHGVTCDQRISVDPPAYPPSINQTFPAIAYDPSAAHALVVWSDQGHYDPDIDPGIWGRLWVPLERVWLPLVLQAG